MRNKILLFLICILPFLFFSCKRKNETALIEKNKSVIIAGEFYNISSLDSLSNIGIYSQDYITKDITSTEQQIDSTGKFKFEIDLSEQQDIMLLHNAIIALLVKPGDSLYLTLDAQSKNRKDILRNLKVNGTASTLNKNLISFFSDDPINYEEYGLSRQKLNPNEFKNYRDSIYNQQSLYIDSLMTKKTFSQPFINWLVAQQLFAKANSFSFFEFYLSNNKKINENKELENSKFDINKIAEISSKHYINTLASNSIPKKILDHTLISSQKEVSSMELDQRHQFYIEKLIKTYSKKPELLKLIVNDFTKSNLSVENINVYESNKEVIDSILGETIFESSLKTMYNDLKKRIDNPSLSDKINIAEYSSTDIKGLLEKIILEADGKPIYIDNWATWCKPCLAEFKENTPNLISQYKGDIEFIFLCYKSDQTQWKSTLSKYNLEGKHYFIEKNQTDDLIDLLSINGFPTYTIISKKGEIVNTGNNFGPSNPETIKILTELVKK